MRYTSLRWVACMLAVFLLGCSSALAEETSLQAVVLVDQSASMYTETAENHWLGSGNDAACFRMDAAAALIGMLDVRNDRAGIVLYHHSLAKGERNGRVYTGKMMSVSRSSMDDREQMIRVLDDACKSTSGGSDVGKAFAEAKRMLSGTSGDARRTIILLTDGGHDVYNAAGDGRSEKSSQDDFNEVVSWARQQNIHVNIVLLRNSAGNQDDIRKAYKAAAESTGGSFYLAEVAAELPYILADVFADEVDTKVIVTKGRKVSGAQYAASVDVPNGTVCEVNILVPGNKNVALLRPDGKEARVDHESVYRFDLRNCTLYKIVAPAGDVGNWSVRYDKAEEMSSDVAVVMNYDVVPQLTVDRTQDVGKAEVIHAELQFHKPDGMTVYDEGMYVGGDIEVQLTLTNDRGEAYGSIVSMKAENDRFAADIDLATLVADQLPEPGVWRLNAKVQGDGMMKAVAPVSINLINHAPEQISAVRQLESVMIHDPVAADYETEYAAEINLNEYFRDADSDSLTYRVLSKPDDVEVRIEGSMLHVRTMDRQTDGNIELQAADSNPHIAGTVNAVIHVHVDNIRAQMKESCTVELVMPDARVGKNEQVTITARVMQDGKQISDEALLKLLTLQYRCNNEKDYMQFTLQKNGDLTAQITTADREAAYAFTGRAFIREFEIAAESLAFTVGNIAPSVHQNLISVLPEQVKTDPFLMLTQDDRMQPIDMNRVFTDTQDDRLTFYAYQISDAQLRANSNWNVAQWMTKKSDLQALAIGEDGVLVLDNRISDGDRFPWMPVQRSAVLLTAVDSDGVSTQTLYSYKIVSQRNTLLWGAFWIVVVFLTVWYIGWCCMNPKWDEEYGALERTNDLAALPDVAFPRKLLPGRKRSAFSLDLVVCSDEFFTSAETNKAVKAFFEDTLILPRHKGNILVRVASTKAENMKVYLEHNSETREVVANDILTWQMYDVMTVTDGMLKVKLKRIPGNKR